MVVATRARLVRLKVASAVVPKLLAVAFTRNVPAFRLAVRTGAVAVPSAPVVTVAAAVNDPFAPPEAEDVVNVTDAPVRGFPSRSSTVTFRFVAKGWPATAL